MDTSTLLRRSPHIMPLSRFGIKRLWGRMGVWKTWGVWCRITALAAARSAEEAILTRRKGGRFIAHALKPKRGAHSRSRGGCT